MNIIKVVASTWKYLDTNIITKDPDPLVCNARSITEENFEMELVPGLFYNREAPVTDGG